jgi:hypothetical protein
MTLLALLRVNLAHDISRDEGTTRTLGETVMFFILLNTFSSRVELINNDAWH